MYLGHCMFASRLAVAKQDQHIEAGTGGTQHSIWNCRGTGVVPFSEAQVRSCALNVQPAHMRQDCSKQMEVCAYTMY